jgi:hypothetical protein
MTSMLPPPAIDMTRVATWCRRVLSLFQSSPTPQAEQ